jgi:hypothetical protein
MARIEKREGYAGREARHFAQWEKEMTRTKEVWNAFVFDREHERLVREVVEASR